MVVEFILAKNAERKPGKVRLKPFGAHEPRELDVIEAIVIGQIWRGELDQCHANDENGKQPDWNECEVQAPLHVSLPVIDQRIVWRSFHTPDDARVYFSGLSRSTIAVGVIIILIVIVRVVAAISAATRVVIIVIVGIAAAIV